MTGFLPFDAPPGQRADAALAGADEELGMDRVMAGLAAAFALDVDLAKTAERRDVEKWPPGRTFWFVVLSSAALWALIVGLVIFL